MTEERYRFWYTIIKAFGVPLTITGVLIGIWQFQITQRQAIAQFDRNEVAAERRDLYQKRLAVYGQLSQTVGGLAANLDDPAKFQESLVAFRTAYWGSMILIEDPDVEQAMIKLNVALQDYSKHVVDGAYVKQRIDAVVTQCRSALQRLQP